MNDEALIGGKEFYSALEAKAMKAVEGIFKSKLYTIQFPSQGDFKWNWQNPNQVFNQDTFKYVSARVSPGEVPGTAKLSPEGGFPNAYDQVLSSLIFSLNQADQQRLQTAQSNASVQAQAIISDYQTSFGNITQAQMDSVLAANKQDYVVGHILGAVWSGRGTTAPLSWQEMSRARNLRDLLPRMPMSGEQVVTDVAVYLNLMQPVIGLQDLLQSGASMITRLKSSTRSPGETNGGMKTVDPNNGVVSPTYQVGYGIASAVSTINNDLQNKGRTISLGMTTSRAAGDSLSVSVEGQAGFTIGSWLKFTTAAGASYDMSKVSGTSMDASISITYAGYSMVPTAPVAWQQATGSGWYSGDPIAQAVKNGNGDVTGFKLLKNSDFDLGPFAKGGNFGQLTNVLIANFPTIKITYTKANFSAFKQAWSQQVSGNLTLFGFIKLGSFAQGAYGSSFEQGADNSTFTVTFSASPEVTSVPQMLKTAYVIAGAIDNPGVTT